MTAFFDRIARAKLLSVLCLAFLPIMAAAQQPATVGAEQTCLDAGCHADVNSKKVLHKPASKATTCRMCHKASAPGQHDFTLAAKKNELCSRCHKMVKDQKSQHMPAKRGMCLNCHDPHQSDNRNLLTKKPAGDLCKGCHRKVVKEAKSMHGPVENWQCTGCHNPHASDESKLLKDKQPDLCFNCHKRPLKDQSGIALPATRQEFEDASLNKHKPFQSGRCSMCHAPHSSENPRLLKRPYPEELYSSYAKENYFCLGCHKAAAFEEARTLTATKFRNGNLNLHFRHVNKDKGRSCRACHEHHAGEFEKLIRNQVPFGNQLLEITQYEVTETGGTCAPMCHLPTSYDRLDPVPVGLKVTPRPGTDATIEELQRTRTETE